VERGRRRILIQPIGIAGNVREPARQPNKVSCAWKMMPPMAGKQGKEQEQPDPQKNRVLLPKMGNESHRASGSDGIPRNQAP
jgi:hypothetical protein